jgi:RNA polymerase sigma factor (TIGR02999 family)
MRSERADHTLQPTALVHEAYARLVDSDISLQDRAHFLALVARSMRRILIDHARAHQSDKRGSGGTRVTLDDSVAGVAAAPSVSIIDLDRALERLEAEDPSRSRAIELHFFGGLTHQEIAEAMHTSESTVRRQLRLARAWLLRELSPESTDER